MSSSCENVKKASINVDSIDKKVSCESQTNTDSVYCDSCEHLVFKSVPDPTDWFCDDEQNAVCTLVNAIIAYSLSIHELTHIYKPLFCPNLGRELTDVEKKIVQINLRYSQNN